MLPTDNSFQTAYTGSSQDSSLEGPPESQYNADLVASRRPVSSHYRRMAFRVTVIALLVILLIGLGGLLLSSSTDKQVAETTKLAANNYTLTSLPVQGLKAGQTLQLSDADHLAVNGQLRVTDSVVLAPSGTPTNPTAGQIYYNKTTGTPYYYNGTQFVSLAPTALPQYVSAIGGISGAISVGNGLQVTGGQLALSAAVTQALAGASAGGVRSLTAGSANVVISQDGNGNYTLSDTSVVGSGSAGQIALFTGGQTLGGSILSQSGGSLIAAGGLTVTGAISTNTLQQTAAGQDVTVSAGNDDLIFTAAGRTFMFPTGGAASQTICTTAAPCVSGGGASVLLQPGSAQLDVGSGTSIFVNNTGGGNLLQLQGAGSDRFVVTNAGNVTATGTVTLSGLSSAGVVHTNASGVLSTGLVVLGTETSGSYVSTLGTLTGLTSGGGGTPTLSVTYGSGANTSVQGNVTLTCASGTGNLSGGGNVLTLGTGGSCNSINTVASPTFTGNLSVQGSGGVTIGVAGTTAGSLLLATTLNTNLATLQSAGLAQATTYTLPDPGQATATICLSTGNCVGSGGAGANAALSNLNSVAINTSLLAGTTTIDLGATAKPFRDLYLGGTATNNFRFTGVASSARTLTIPDATGTICLSTGNCVGSGGAGDISGNGTSGTIARFSGTKTIVDSIITESGTTITVAGTLNATTALQTAGTTRITNAGVLQNVTNANASNFFTGGTLPVARGGTGSSATPNNGQLLIGNGSGYSLATLASGDNTVVITNGGGTIDLSAPGAGTCASCVSLQASTPGSQQTGNINVSGAVLAGSFNGQTISSAANFTGTVAIQGATGLTLGAASTNTGAIVLKNSTNANTLTLQSGATGSNISLTLPTTDGNSGDCLTSDGSGVLSFTTCPGAGGTGVTTVGAIDNQVKSANGAVISGTTIYLQTADATNVGLVSTGSQTFAGAKTFTGSGNGSTTFGGLFKNGSDSTTAFQIQRSNADVLLGADTTGNVIKIGNSTASTASDTTLLQVDSATTANLPVAGAGLNGSLIYDSTLGKFKIIEGGAYKTLCNTTDLACGSSVSAVTSLNGNTGSVTIQGTANQVLVTGNAINPIVLSLPQSIAVSSSPVFATVNLTTGVNTGAGAGTQRIDASGNLVNIGTITSGLINGQTISSSASFTGTLAVATLGGTTGAVGICRNTSNQISSCGNNPNGVTLQQAYDADADSADATIALTGTDGNLIFQNPSSGGVSSGAVLKLNQLASGAVEGLRIESAGTGNLLTIRDTTATAQDVLTIANGGAATFRSQTNSSAAFNVQDAAGNNMLNINNALNLVANPSFETNTTGWSAKGGVGAPSRVTTQASAGVASLSIPATAVGHGATTPVAFSSGTTYTLSGYAKFTDVTVNSKIELGYSADGVTDTPCQTSPNITSASSGFNWTKYTCVIPNSVTYSGTPYIYFKTVSGGGSAYRTFFVDAFSVEANSVVRPYAQNDLTLFDSANYGRLGLNTAAPEAYLHIQIPDAGDVPAFKITQQGNASAYAMFGQLTSTSGVFVPGFAGSTNSTNSQHANLNFAGVFNNTNGTAGQAAILFQAGRSPNGLPDGVTPISGGADLLQVNNGNTNILTLAANGDLSLATGDLFLTAGSYHASGAVGTSLACGANKGVKSVTLTGGIVTAAVCTTNTLTDLAEQYNSTETLAAAEVVSIDADHAEYVKRTTQTYQPGLVGIVSTAPNQVLGEDNPGYPIALAGRVPVKVSDENGAIQPGDYLTSSSTPGVAMKATQPGPTVGQAMTAFTAAGTGSVIVFVNPVYFVPSDSDQLQGSNGLFNDLNVSGDTTLANLTVAGDATIEGKLTVTAIVTGDLTISGHIITAGGQPTAQAQVAAGPGATVTVSGTDSAGTITITTGSAPTAGELAQLTFSKVYAATPRVVLSPSNDSAGDLRYFKGATDSDSFRFNAKGLPAANTTYTFDYIIAQ